MERQENSAGFDRRRFIKGAATVAWATPLVLSMGAGTAHAQPPSPGACLGANARPEGCPCTTSAQCLDGCCCGPELGGGGACTSQENCDTFPGSACAA
jgi:hypothetical protein